MTNDRFAADGRTALPMRPITTIAIRRARPEEAEELSAIAQASKRHLGYAERLLELWRAALTLTRQYVEAHEVFVAETDSTIVGFYALLAAADRWELDHLWLRPAAIGQGVGSALFHHAVGRLREIAPGASIHIEAEPSAEPFSQHLGAYRIGEIERWWGDEIRRLPHLVFTDPDT